MFSMSLTGLSPGHIGHHRYVVESLGQTIAEKPL